MDEPDNQEQPLMMNEEGALENASSKPSDKWPAYTDSKFSDKHLTKATRKIRTSTPFLTAANLIKMYVGIAFISVPKSISQAGLYGSIIGFIYIILMNVFCIYILLKARNRFKREEIIDLCDLSVRLYGPGTRPIMSILIIVTNSVFLMAYTMFFGAQIDQLMCKTFKTAECGRAHEYSIYIALALLPILFVRRLAHIGTFSAFVLVFTFIAIGLIVYVSAEIYVRSPQEVEDDYGLHITDEDRNYNYWDTSMIPIFCATMMTLFEGNQQILNLYSEADSPSSFFVIALSCILVLTVCIAAVVGYVGYLAFGATVKSVILLNLPNEEPLSITAKCCYVLTIMGSFVLVIQPIFYIVESSNWYKGTKPDKKDDEDKSNKEEPAEGAAPAEPAEPENKEEMEGGEGSSADDDEDESTSCCDCFKFMLVRTLIVFTIVLISFLIPNIHILLTICGAILGTIVNILLPVLFYNRAYSFTPKNRKLERAQKEEANAAEGEEGEMMMAEQEQQEQPEQQAEEQAEEEASDSRSWVKVGTWVVLFFGTIIGIVGLVYVIVEMRDGEAKSESS